MKEKSNWLPWELWSNEWKFPSEKGYKALAEQFEGEIEYHTFLQYLCFDQLETVIQEAKQCNILLKGDIPFLTSRDSADVWYNRQLFNLDYTAGAPPDMHNPEGQNWGFPIYHWKEHRDSDFSWWKQRLSIAAKLYDLYRLDHIVGFYRIWCFHNSKGRFLPANKDEWITQGETILQVMLECSDLFPVGEDLGVVPSEVRENLHTLGICGTKVMRWERHWNKDQQYIPYEEYDPISMTTVSTHDTETLQQWWSINPDEAKTFCHYKGWEHTPKLPQDRHFQILKDSHHTGSLLHINLLNEYLALIPGMTWDSLEDERINIPGTISEKNWSYRFRPPLETITSSTELKQVMKDVIQ